METCERALAHYPQEVALRQALARALHAVDRTEEAIEALRGALALDPDNVQAVHALAAFGGSPTPQRAAPEYVAELFDGYADNFDHHLVDVLEYRIPQLLYDAVLDATGADFRDQDILDLGCGTGLCAPLFRAHAKRLVGVDLSARMVDRARERGLYDDLHVDDLVNVMAAEPNAYDLVLAADVFVYIGELSDIFEACRNGLRPDGLFAFSTETLEGGNRGYALHPTGRYAHSADYLHEQAARAGFEVLSHEPAMIRKNEGAPVNGHISVLRKTAQRTG
ncbi:MAG: methyltransferase domain-containing protein [Gammaproteobacteria bacterium]